MPFWKLYFNVAEGLATRKTVFKRIVRENPMMRWATLLCVGVVTFGGCAAIDDYHYSLVNHRRSELAWQQCSKWHDRRDGSSHYASGWKQGYFDVCTGGSGEPPAVPPSKYWSPRFQGESGQSAVEDWFVGYQDGATAAQSTGVGEWHPIYTGPTIPMAPVGWPSVEMFPSQTFSAEPAATETLQPFSTAEPQRLAPTEQVPQGSTPSGVAQELAPNELEAFPPLDASRRLPPPTDEANAASPSDDMNARPPSAEANAAPPTEVTNLAPPVFTDE